MMRAVAMVGAVILAAAPAGRPGPWFLPLAGDRGADLDTGTRPRRAAGAAAIVPSSAAVEAAGIGRPLEWTGVSALPPSGTSG
jgi:hypothetical protein